MLCPARPGEAERGYAQMCERGGVAVLLRFVVLAELRVCGSRDEIEAQRKRQRQRCFDAKRFVPHQRRALRLALEAVGDEDLIGHVALHGLELLAHRRRLILAQ